MHRRSKSLMLLLFCQSHTDLNGYVRHRCCRESQQLVLFSAPEFLNSRYLFSIFSLGAKRKILFCSFLNLCALHVTTFKTDRFVNCQRVANFPNYFMNEINLKRHNFQAAFTRVIKNMQYIQGCF